MNWFKGLSNPWKAIVAVLVAIAAIWALMFIRDLFVGSKDVEAKLGTNQAGAAIESGKDAVETADTFQEDSADIDNQVEDFENAIDDARGAANDDAVARQRLCEQSNICD